MVRDARIVRVHLMQDPDLPGGVAEPCFLLRSRI